VGIEEGDGGASYSGAQMWSYGNILRYNFYHHLMKYPLFTKVMNTDPYLPLECRFANNMFCETGQQFEYRVNYSKDGTIDIRQAPGIQLENNVDLPLSAFEDPACLDFRIRPDYPMPNGIQRIPVEKIGLYLDEYRAHMPNEADYRRKIREKYEGKPSFEPDAVYDPDTINGRINHW
jgi:hypothetical protein